MGYYEEVTICILHQFSFFFFFISIIRTGSIYWFIISLIFELAVLISSCLQDEDELVAGIIASALFLILTIQGLTACYLFIRTQIMFALIGVMIKALLNFIGFIALLAITAESVKIEYEESDRIDFIMVALVTFLFYSSGIVVVWKVLKERNGAV